MTRRELLRGAACVPLAGVVEAVTAMSASTSCPDVFVPWAADAFAAWREARRLNDAVMEYNRRIVESVLQSMVDAHCREKGYPAELTPVVVIRVEG